MKIAVVDTYYPDFLATLPTPASYEEGLDYALSRFFGTHSAYSRGLRGLGHEAIDIIANHDKLQQQWAVENGFGGDRGSIITLEQINRFNPDVVFFQDLSIFHTETLRQLSSKYVLAGQCSCRFDDDERLKQFDVLFTSFPFYVDRFNKLGVQGVFLPLAFDPIVLERAQIPTSRTHAVSFVGGYGQHWEMDQLFTTLAEHTPIEFWGYGFENAPEVVRRKWRGPVWGLDMYEIYMGSHIVLNRHGGIAGGYANNLRMFEATGCGAMLITDYAPNIHDYFAPEEALTYSTPMYAVDLIRHYLGNPEQMQRIASNGQRKTLSAHTYAQRMPIVSETLKELVAAKVPA